MRSTAITIEGAGLEHFWLGPLAFEGHDERCERSGSSAGKREKKFFSPSLQELKIPFRTIFFIGMKKQQRAK